MAVCLQGSHFSPDSDWRIDLCRVRSYRKHSTMINFSIIVVFSVMFSVKNNKAYYLNDGKQ